MKNDIGEDWIEYLWMTESRDAMWCDGDSEPFVDWDYSSPQPEVTSWDSN